MICIMSMFLLAEEVYKRRGVLRSEIFMHAAAGCGAYDRRGVLPRGV